MEKQEKRKEKIDSRCDSHLPMSSDLDNGRILWIHREDYRSTGGAR